MNKNNSENQAKMYFDKINDKDKEEKLFRRYIWLILITVFITIVAIYTLGYILYSKRIHPLLEMAYI